MNYLHQVMRQEALKAMAQRESSKLGIVSDYDPVNYLVQVELYGADVDGTPPLLTGWLPLMTLTQGFYAPPAQGSIVAVHFQDGSLQNGFVSLTSYSPLNPPSAEAQAGEFWYVNATGSLFKFTMDGNVTIVASNNLNLTVTGTVNLTAATVNISSANINMGDLMGTLTGLMNSTAVALYNSHTHDISGGGITLVPNELMDSTNLTTNTKAN